MKFAPIHVVLGKQTTFVEGRRLLLEGPHTDGAFQLTDQVLADLPAPRRDQSKQMVWRTNLLGERPSNFLAAIVAPLLVWRKFWLEFGLLAVLAVLLSVWSAVLTPPPPLSRPTWEVLSLHYLILVCILGWHELGHLAAVNRAGLRVDGLGGGFYLIFPALFSNISLIVLAPYRDRMKIYAAGVAFQFLFGIVASIILLFTADPLARFAVIANLSTLVVNLIPGVKLDGHRMVDEVASQPWSAPYRGALATLTIVSSIGITGLAVFAMSMWLWYAVPDVLRSPSILGVLMCTVPVALLTLCLVSVVKGAVRRND